MHCGKRHAVDVDGSMVTSKKEVSCEVHADEEGMEDRCRDQTPKAQMPNHSREFQVSVLERARLRHSLAQKGRAVEDAKPVPEHQQMLLLGFVDPLIHLK